MRVLTARQHDPPHDRQRGRVDHGQVVVALHGDQHPVAVLVVADVAHLATQLDCSPGFQSGCVHDGFGSGGFVGGPDRVAARVVGQPVGILAGAGLPEHLTGALVDGDHLIGAGRGGIHPTQQGDDQHPVHLGDVGDGAHHPTGTHVDLDDLAGTQVSDEQQTTLRIEAGVVEPRIIARQSDFGDWAQR